MGALTHIYKLPGGPHPHRHWQQIPPPAHRSPPPIPLALILFDIVDVVLVRYHLGSSSSSSSSSSSIRSSTAMIGTESVPQVPRSTPAPPSSTDSFTMTIAALADLQWAGQFPLDTVPVWQAIIYLVVCGAGVYAAIQFLVRRRRQMPPGPPPALLVGNKIDPAAQKPVWYKYKEWSGQYGSLFTMWSGPRPTVVIGDPQVAHDLLHLKPIIFGSRPRFVVMGELFAKNGLLLTMPYGPKFTATKRMMNMSLVARDLNAHAVQEAESKKLARDLINSGYSFERHINRYVASVMMCLAYGRRIDNMDDPVLEKIYQRARYMAQLNTAGRYWAETFPLLTWIPDFLAPWKREIKRNGAASSQMLYDLAKEAEEPIGYDRAAPKSFAKNLWEKKKHEPALNLNEWEIANAAGSLFNAGSDTSSATLQTFILAMTVFPEVAAKAQEEIDRVVGHDRVPTWEDRQNLPYCRAILKETLRWRPVAVLGGNPHCSTEDYHYRGHYIPKGTAVMGNLWAIHHNEEYFVDSHRFWPERYTEPEKVQAFCKPYPNPEGHSSFGWGVRACPGKGLAEDSLFISIVRILWGFNITKARDPATKEEITPSTFSYTTGFNTKPTPFPCVFTPRSDKHREILLQDASAADEFLKGYRTG